MKTLRLIFAFALGMAVASCGAARPVPPTPAPSWQLKDPDGKVVSSDQFKGKVVVVDFWATWCPPCVMEIPGYIELQKKYPNDLVIVGISVDDGPEVVKQFVEKRKVDYPVVMASNEVVAAFGGDEGISAIPTTFIIDRDGNIRERKLGAEHKDAFEKRLVKYLK